MLQGHPWIFSNSIEKITDGGEAGDVCVIFLKKSNKVGGIGLYNPGSPIRIMMLSNEGPMQLDEGILWIANSTGLGTAYSTFGAY